MPGRHTLSASTHDSSWPSRRVRPHSRKFYPIHSIPQFRMDLNLRPNSSGFALSRYPVSRSRWLHSPSPYASRRSIQDPFPHPRRYLAPHAHGRVSPALSTLSEWAFILDHLRTKLERSYVSPFSLLYHAFQLSSSLDKKKVSGFSHRISPLSPLPSSVRQRNSGMNLHARSPHPSIHPFLADSPPPPPTTFSTQSPIRTGYPFGTIAFSFTPLSVDQHTLGVGWVHVVCT